MTAQQEAILTNARLPGSEGVVDVLMLEGTIATVTPAGVHDPGGADVSDLDGRFLLPGLWDNHVHMTQWVIQQQRLDLRGTNSAAEVLDLVSRSMAGREGEPLVGFGFRDGLWSEPPSAQALDRITGALPAVLISADLHCAWMNTAAQHLLGATADEDGLVREDAWFIALERLQDLSEVSSAQFMAVSRAAARRGVVGIVDFENADNITAWPQRVDEGVNALRVEASVWPNRLDEAIAAHIRTGDRLHDSGLVTMGPLKIIADGSLNTRTAWCWDPYPGAAADHPHACGIEIVPLDELRDLMRRAHDAGIGAAIHAIGDRANASVLDAFEALAMTGRIEHAQLLSWEDIPRFQRLGLAASVQPEHAMDDRDVADVHWQGRTERAFALRSLHEASVPIHLGSDAPVAPLDPWLAIASAATRKRGDREPWHPEQRIPVEAAVAGSTRGGSQVREGQPADLAVIERDPFTCSGDELRTMPVAATLVGGRFTWCGL